MRYYKSGIRALVTGFLFFFCLHGLCSLDLRITGKELGAGLRGEYNRSFSWCWDYSTFGALELNRRYSFSSGLALGSVEREFEIKIYGSAGLAPLSWIARLSNLPFKISLAYFYYGLPGMTYNLHAHSVFPSVAFNGKWAGVTLGPNFRFSNYLGGPPVFESMLSFLGYVNFINSEKLRIGLSLGNINEYYQGNMGLIFLRIDSAIRITEQWSIINGLELFQGGIDGLTTAFYGIAYRGGLRFVW